MSFNFDAPRASKQVFWLNHKTTMDRVIWLLPVDTSANVHIESTELSGNASFVNYVRHHRITLASTGEVIDVVEKSIRKIAGIASLESRFYRDYDLLTGSMHFKYPRCFGVIETPCESLIFSEYIQGPAPRMYAVAQEMALGITELESLTHAYLLASPSRSRFRYWQMDFFRSWYLLRPRFNFARGFPNLRLLASEDSSFVGLEAPLRNLVVVIRTLAWNARRAPRCFCHMDFLRKNLFANAQGLHLIDWSEVKVGRIGFDAGAYLSALFRRNEMSRYIQAHDDFLKTYQTSLNPQFDPDIAKANMLYVFLLNSLWHCMRTETIREFRDSGRLPLLREKLLFLLSLQK